MKQNKLQTMLIRKKAIAIHNDMLIEREWMSDFGIRIGIWQETTQIEDAILESFPHKRLILLPNAPLDYSLFDNCW